MNRILVSLSLAGIAAVSACATGADEGSQVEARLGGKSRSYIVMAASSLPGDIDAKIVAAGGSVTGRRPELGIVFATSSESDFASKVGKVSGIRSVTPDLKIQMLDPAEQAVELDSATADSVLSSITDSRLPLLWGMQAIHASDAWDRGNTGAGVRVAVLDTGIWADHPDLNANVNRALSTSFVAGESWLQPGGLPLGSYHGTHVAGTIAAKINGLGVVGVAPDAELVAVKVLGNSGSGSFSGIIAGVAYAVEIHADVVNMSLGGTVKRSGECDADGNCDTAKDISELIVASSRATTYARQNGVTIIASAGNDALDFDHSADIYKLPASLPGVVRISATGPVGWATGHMTACGLDCLASYSNYGASVISFAAPGGDFVYPGNENCSVAGIVRPCWVFDLVFSDVYGGYAWFAGTSMAAPHASGVAALIIKDAGGHGSLSPAAVEQALRANAEDLGKPGNDAAYGGGRVRVY